MKSFVLFILLLTVSVGQTKSVLNKKELSRITLSSFEGEISKIERFGPFDPEIYSDKLTFIDPSIGLNNSRLDRLSGDRHSADHAARPLGDQAG